MAKFSGSQIKIIIHNTPIEPADFGTQAMKDVLKKIIGQTYSASFTFDPMPKSTPKPAAPPDPDSPYTILGLDSTASADDIRSAYRRLAKNYHPDLNRGATESSTSMFIRVKEAYEVLSDPKRRKKYDAARKLLEKRTEEREEDWGGWNLGSWPSGRGGKYPNPHSGSLNLGGYNMSASAMVFTHRPPAHQPQHRIALYTTDPQANTPVGGTIRASGKPWRVINRRIQNSIAGADIVIFDLVDVQPQATIVPDTAVLSAQLSSGFNGIGVPSHTLVATLDIAELTSIYGTRLDYLNPGERIQVRCRGYTVTGMIADLQLTSGFTPVATITVNVESIS